MGAVASSQANDCNRCPIRVQGPGPALDGNPKFNLMEFNQEYFDRLRSRVIAAGECGIYVSVMLFQGWGIESKAGFSSGGNLGWVIPSIARTTSTEWMEILTEMTRASRLIRCKLPKLHPYKSPTSVRSWLRSTISTMSSGRLATKATPHPRTGGPHLISFLKRCEADQPMQHPVGMTFCFPGGKNADLFDSPADWISPNSVRKDDYCENPPAGDGRKVIVSDTDHLWGVGGDRAWVWKSFTRGLNPIFMDPVDETPQWESSRRAMGITLTYANRMNLSTMRPRGDLASSGYCLANPGEEYLVYVPARGPLA